MARNGGEYGGTEPASSGASGNDSVIAGSSIDPASLAGAGAGGTTDSAGGTFDPAIHSGPDKFNADGTFRRKRGRKSGGGGNNPGKASSQTDLKSSVEMLSQTLALLHMGIASATSAPEMVIDKNESDMLAKATVNLLDQFDITPDPKMQAVAGLIIAAGSVYGPRVYLIRERLKEQARNRENPGGAIVEFPSVATAQ